MSTVCTVEQHKFHPSHQFLPSKKTLLKDINIPPRKLLSRHENAEMIADSPRFSFTDDALFHRFLQYENGGGGGDSGDSDDDEDDPYSSDFFRMYEFKVRRCNRSRSHDWTDCPFAHPGEKARRRDPRRFNYSGEVCPEFRRGGCSRGDSCEFAHGVFECWLHPARYRTEACKDGKNCKRKVCFFAHSPRQLRILPVNNSGPKTCLPEMVNKKKLLSSASGSNHCCSLCHCGTTNSPTSTLLGVSHFSPPLSPPLSPVKPHSLNGFSTISRYNESKLSGVVLTDLMSSMEAMNFNDSVAPSPVYAQSPMNRPWIDVSFVEGENQQQFNLSPSTPTTTRSANFSVKSFFDENYNRIKTDNGLSCSVPDIGWVDELLM